MKDKVSNNFVKCPICEQTIKLCGHTSYYTCKSRYRSPIYFCKDCYIFYRKVDDSIRIDHFYAASYVQERNEPMFLEARINFFKYLISLAKKFVNRKSMNEEHKLILMDFGSSYGHLIGLAREQGIHALGVELNKNLIALCKKRNLTVYRNITELPEKVDVVTSVDSFYYIHNPKDVLRDIKNCLKPDGIFIARVTNRNLYVRLRASIRMNRDYSGIGDASISYSLKGLKKLLSLAGFRIVKVIPDNGKGKKMAFRKSFFYQFSYILTILTGQSLILTPGFIILAKLK